MLNPTPKDQALAPAFCHKWQLWLFLAFVGACLALPLLPKPAWMDRSILYESSDIRSTRNSYLANRILGESSDIDILFIGSSHLGVGINPLIIKDALKPILGKDPVIYVVTHSAGVALDYDYIAAQDILSKRRVKLLLWANIEGDGGSYSNNGTYGDANYLWDFGLHHIPLMKLENDRKVSIYFYSVMNQMRLILPIKDRRIIDDNCAIEKYLGACPRFENQENLGNFPPITLPVESLIHFRSHDANLSTNGKYSSYSRAFSDSMFNLAAQHGTKIAFLQLPLGLQPLDKILVPTMEPDQPGADAPIVGATPAELFPGQDRKTIAQYYYDTDKQSVHLKAMPAAYVTRALLPGIIEIFLQTMHITPAQP